MERFDLGRFEHIEMPVTYKLIAVIRADIFWDLCDLMTSLGRSLTCLDSVCRLITGQWHSQVSSSMMLKTRQILFGTA